MHRRPVSAAAALAALALLLSGCSGDDPVAPAAAEVPAVASPSTVPSAVPSAVPSTVPSSAAASPSPSPSGAAASPSPARPSYDVAAAQRALVAGGYYAGPVDGQRGPALRSAVMAFQKVQGVGADGVVGPATLKALASPRRPVLKASSPADRVEVDLTRQVLYVVEDGAVERILPVSSGNGETYRQKSGGTARALTPVGRYTVQRRIVGVREADLGTLYDPQYFYKGWAIHGSNSVPAGPASHGCVRVTRADAKYLLRAISVGTTVVLYGGEHTFSAGSGAPGTDAPTGDTPQDAPVEASPSPSVSPSIRPASPSPARPSTSPTRPASPAPSATSPAPSPSAASAPPSPSPARSSAAPTSPAASPSASSAAR